MSHQRSCLLSFAAILSIMALQSVEANSASSLPMVAHTRYSFLPHGRHSSSSSSNNSPFSRRGVSSSVAGLDFLDSPVRSAVSQRPLTGHSRQQQHHHHRHPMDTVLPCSIAYTLFRGAFLRVASDLSGGTPLESIKTRVTLTTEGPWQATCNIVRSGGLAALWTGTPSRTVEGALIGAVFMLGSVLTKNQLKKLGAPPTVAALAGGLVGGVAQAVIMTPAGLVFTALNNDRQTGTANKETTLGVVTRVVKEKGVAGMFAGGRPMCIRQATNWASRSGFTEIARSSLRLSKYGILGEIAAGAVGGVGSCWNTPIETIRVYTQRDVSQGKEPKPMAQYWDEIVKESGYPGLFRGVTPRAIQAIWQTVFLVVVPNLMGI
jgi:Mitochondrial carrier protein